MTKDEIRALLNDLESDRVERTISTTNTDKFGQAICAFANDLPDYRMSGYLFYRCRKWWRGKGAECDRRVAEECGSNQSWRKNPATTFNGGRKGLDGRRWYWEYDRRKCLNMVALKIWKLRATYERFKSGFKNVIFATRWKSEEIHARKIIKIRATCGRD